MKYIIRVVKYFVYITILMSVVLALMVAFKFVDGDINTMFRDGYDSLWKIALMFLAVSALYPKFGYCKRGAIIPGEYKDVRDTVVSYMEDHGYVLETEVDENLTFRCKSPLMKSKRMWEDRLTFTHELPGFYIEGLTKDVVRVISGLEAKFREE